VALVDLFSLSDFLSGFLRVFLLIALAVRLAYLPEKEFFCRKIIGNYAVASLGQNIKNPINTAIFLLTI
jgi:hypothetical protein